MSSSKPEPTRRSKRDKVPSLKMQEAEVAAAAASTTAATTSSSQRQTATGVAAHNNSNNKNNNSSNQQSSSVDGESFPVRLHQMITEFSTETDAMDWSEDGSSFYMQQTHPDVKTILKEYLGYGMDSLRRRMNAYGFKRSHFGAKTKFEQKNFHRDFPEKAKMMIEELPEEKLPFLNFPNDGIASAVASAAATLSAGLSGGGGDRPAGERSRAPAGVLSFPALMHRVACEESVRSQAITWSEDGHAMYLHAEHPALPGVLQTHWNHTNHESLHRQLNVYGWVKPRSGIYKGGFVRKHFHRDRPQDVHKIKRRPGRNDRARRQRRLQQMAAVGLKKRSSIRGAYASESSSSSGTSMPSTIHDYDLDTFATSDAEDICRPRKAVAFKGRDDDDLSTSSSSTASSASPDDAIPAVDAPSETAPAVQPKFQDYQKVFARDKDGVMYEAVIRRKLFGNDYHKQVQMGFGVESSEQANELLKEKNAVDSKPTWHYFVHYNKWNVNWDRWVPEDKVYLPTPHVRAYAAALMSEYKAVRHRVANQGRGSRAGKKVWQGVDGLTFLTEWRKSLIKVGIEMQFEHNGGDDNAAGSKPADKAIEDAVAATKTRQATAWTKAAIAMEMKLRETSLTSSNKRKLPGAMQTKIVLPFSLKKILVEQWEVISQCDMLPQLPSKVTVSQALDKYLESKGVVVNSNKSAEEPTEGETSNVDSSVMAGSTTIASPNSAANGEAPSNPGTQTNNDVNEEWTEMCEGIAKLFDEALPFRLLYREESPQSKVLELLPEFSLKRFSDIYGCEHLLRLFVRLPEMLADYQDEISEQEIRTIVAKVNDFVRFLHKNQAVLFAQRYRKLNDLELKESRRLARLEEKKKKKRKQSMTIAEEQQNSKRTTGITASSASTKIQ